MGSPEEIRVLAWQDVASEARKLRSGEKLLSAGSLVVGFENLLQVDALTDICMSVTADRCRRGWIGFNPDNFTLSTKGHHTYMGWKDGLRHADEVMKPKRFFGTLINIEALLFDDITALETKGNSELSTNSLSYGIFANMHSTGQGVIGRVAKLVQVKSYLSANGYSLVPSVSYSDLPTNTAEKAAMELQAKSIRTNHEVIARGLRLVYPAGLPGHGKKR